MLFREICHHKPPLTVDNSENVFPGDNWGNKITDYVKKAYLTYFGMKLSDQDKAWAPCIVCKPCVETMTVAKRPKKSTKL